MRKDISVSGSQSSVSYLLSLGKGRDETLGRGMTAGEGIEWYLGN